MLRMSLIPTSPTQKLKKLIDKFDEDDYGENAAKKTSALIKEPIGADYPSSNHVSHAVSNFVSNSAQNVSNYPTSDAKRAFNQLRQAFTKALILQYFHLKQYIQVQTDAFGHAIGGMLSQLTNDLGWWHPVAYFLCKMILAETQYKTHNSELLLIVTAFKTWQYYLKNCKYKILVFTDQNNLCGFIDTKSLTFC